MNDFVKYYLDFLPRKDIVELLQCNGQYPAHQLGEAQFWLERRPYVGTHVVPKSANELLDWVVKELHRIKHMHGRNGREALVGLGVATWRNGDLVLTEEGIDRLFEVFLGRPREKEEIE